MRRKRCPLCSRVNTKRHGTRTKIIRTSQGAKRSKYQYWYCKDCKKAFRPSKGQATNFSLQVKACELYFDSEASYRAVSRQLGLAPYRLFEIINNLGAGCKSSLEVARELNPRWSGYLLVDEKVIWIKGVKWFVLLAVDLSSQDIVHWDLVAAETEVNVLWFFMVIKHSIGYPFKGIISDLLPEFLKAVRWLLPGIPHQYCTRHVLAATEVYLYQHYEGTDTLWRDRLMLITRIICQCRTLETALQALHYMERNERQFRRAGLAKRLHLLRKRFPHLILRLVEPRLKSDNNVIENVIKQLNQKFKKTGGYESYPTAYNSISLLIMRYRFHKFSCSRIPGHNGKSPLQLAGVDTSNTNWVRFSQRTDSDSRG